eukprot:gene9120-18892_t
MTEWKNSPMKQDDMNLKRVSISMDLQVMSSGPSELRKDDARFRHFLKTASIMMFDSDSDNIENMHSIQNLKSNKHFTTMPHNTNEECIEYGARELLSESEISLNKNIDPILYYQKFLDSVEAQFPPRVTSSEHSAILNNIADIEEQFLTKHEELLQKGVVFEDYNDPSPSTP